MKIQTGITAIACLLLSGGLVSAEKVEDVKVDIDKEECQRVETHIARDDVAYKPGVDVRGNPVAPADLDGTPLKLPKNIVIDLSLPLADLYAPGTSPPRIVQGAEVEVGKIEYNILSGKFTFNGQTLADPALHAIAEECHKIYGK
jgi:hypothetical protein